MNSTSSPPGMRAIQSVTGSSDLTSLLLQRPAGREADTGDVRMADELSRRPWP
jgi:hypothetical protein